MFLLEMRLILNSEGEPDKSVDDWSAKAKEKKVLVLDGDQGERELDLVHNEFTSHCVMVCIAPVRIGRTPRGTSSRSWSGGTSR